MFEFKCPACARQLQVPEDLAADEYRCPGCETVFSVPGRAIAPQVPTSAGVDQIKEKTVAPYARPSGTKSRDQITEVVPTVPKCADDADDVDERLGLIKVIPEDGTPDEIIDEEAEAAAEDAQALADQEDEKQIDLEREFRWRRAKLGAGIGLLVGCTSGVVSFFVDVDAHLLNTLAAIVGAVVIGCIHGIMIGAMSYVTGTARPYVERLLLGILTSWIVGIAYLGWRLESVIVCILYAGATGLVLIFVIGLSLILVIFCVRRLWR